ncbi:MAG: PIN domain-containing protein [Myxococcales bacterium]|nr:PIN domain-containing protein [Myxococcales bacterium]
MRFAPRSAILTFDGGVLIALERGQQRAARVLRAATDTGRRITVPTVVIAEWWRGRTDVREEILGAVDVEPLSERVARLAGEAQAAVPKTSAIDAMVMASAAMRGDLVYTSDFDDLDRLRRFFPSVRVLRV